MKDDAYYRMAFEALKLNKEEEKFITIENILIHEERPRAVETMRKVNDLQIQKEDKSKSSNLKVFEVLYRKILYQYFFKWHQQSQPKQFSAIKYMELLMGEKKQKQWAF